MLGFGVGVILHQVTNTPRSKVGTKRVQCGQAHVINLRALHPLDGRRRKSCLLRNLGKGQITILPCFFVASKLVKVALKHFRLSIHQTAYLQINMVIFYHEALDKVNRLSHNIVVNLQFMNLDYGVKLQKKVLGFKKGFDYERCFSNCRRVGPRCSFACTAACRACPDRRPSRRATGEMNLSVGVLADSFATSGQRGDTHDPRGCTARCIPSPLGGF